jgi:hypothetical protein
MARGEKLKQSQTMIQAAESGMAGRQRAHEALLNTEAQGRRDITNAAVQIGGLAEEGERRQMQERESQADRGVRTDIASAEIEGRNIDRQVEAADKGIEGVGTVPNPFEERKRRTEAEMARGAEQTGAAEQPPAAPGGGGGIGQLPPDQAQRMADQAGKPMEYTGASGYQSTQGPRRSQRRITQEAQQARIVEQQITLNDQRIAKGAFDYKQAQLQPPGEKRDQMSEAAMENLNKGLIRTEEFINEVMKGSINAGDVARAHPQNPQMAELAQSGAADTPEGKARVVQFLRGQLGHQQISYMAASGKMPPGYDPSNPVIRKFNERFNEVAASFRQTNSLTGMDMRQGDAFDQATAQQEGGALAGAWQGIKSVEERNDFLRKTTAQIMVEAEKYRVDQAAVMKAAGWAEKEQQYLQTIQQKDMEIEQLRRTNAIATGGQPGEDVGGPTSAQRGETETKNVDGRQVEVLRPDVAAKRAGNREQQRKDEGERRRGLPEGYGTYRGGLR